MKRKIKDICIQNIMNIFLANNFLILVNFRSLNSIESLSIRNDLKRVNGRFLVIKNTLARLALKQTNDFSYLLDKFFGPVALVYTDASIIEIAKLIVGLDKERVSIVCATLSKRFLTVEEVSELAELPSLDKLRIKIMHLISYSVPSRLALSINSPMMRLGKILNYCSSEK
ncbi:50S ribosomal protein L10 [Wolbachia endosymbiont of Pentidionis agamae]|uniref:50S ribosomal protein L10 n=1 Tax=Wolbachia endosymbiont of Pentidionis agamae TaxID=3110435 RepID=UPI002FCFD477